MSTWQLVQFFPLFLSKACILIYSGAASLASEAAATDLKKKTGSSFYCLESEATEIIKPEK